MLQCFQEINGISPIFSNSLLATNNEKNKITYFHPKIAIRFAIFLDHKFGFWIEDLINKELGVQGSLFEKKVCVTFESEYSTEPSLENMKESSHVPKDLLLKLTNLEKDIFHIREWCDFIKEKESEQKKWFDLSFLNQALTTTLRTVFDSQR